MIEIVSPATAGHCLDTVLSIFAYFSIIIIIG